MNEERIAEQMLFEGIDCKGFGLIFKSVMTDNKISAGAKAIYAFFRSYAGNSNSACPNRERIISSLKINKSTYYVYLNQLIDNEYIRIDRAKKSPFNNTYIIVSNPKKIKNVKMNTDNSDKLILKGIKAFGYGTVPKAVMVDDRLHVKAKALYAYFSSFSGNGTTAFPKRSDILNHLQISINPFQKYMN